MTLFVINTKLYYKNIVKLIVIFANKIGESIQDVSYFWINKISR